MTEPKLLENKIEKCFWYERECKTASLPDHLKGCNGYNKNKKLCHTYLQENYREKDISFGLDSKEEINEAK